jgi:hypothetical protein
VRICRRQGRGPWVGQACEICIDQDCQRSSLVRWLLLAPLAKTQPNLFQRPGRVGLLQL